MWNVLSGKWTGPATGPGRTLQRELAARQSRSHELPQPPRAPSHADKSRVAGIYVIVNRVDGRMYVAGDEDIQGAIARDRAELRRGRHRNERLQSDWNWFGEENFALGIVATIDSADGRRALASLVDAWRDELRSYGDTGYNARTRVAF